MVLVVGNVAFLGRNSAPARNYRDHNVNCLRDQMSELAARLAAYQRREIASLERSAMIYRGLADEYEQRLAEARAIYERSERE